MLRPSNLMALLAVFSHIEGHRLIFFQWWSRFSKSVLRGRARVLKRHQRRTQLHTSRDGVVIVGTAGGVMGAALTVASGAVFFSDMIELGKQQRAREFSVSKTTEMTPRRRTTAPLLPAAKERTAAEQCSIEAQQRVTTQDTTGGRIGEAGPSVSRGGKEKHEKFFHGHGRWAAVAGRGKDGPRSSYKDKVTGDAFERTPSSSPSLSWEDVEDPLPGINAYAIRHTEYQSSVQRVCKHQHLLRSRGSLETFWLPPARETVESRFSHETLQPSSDSRVDCARAQSAADALSHSGTLEFAAVPQLRIKERRSSGIASITASALGARSGRAISTGKVGGGGGGDQGLASEARLSAAFPLLDEKRGSRRRAVSCPCGSERPLNYAHPSSQAYVPISGFVAAPPGASSSEAINKSSPPRLCGAPVSPPCNAARYNSFVRLRISEPSSVCYHQRTPENVFGSNPAAEVNTPVAEQSDSGRFVCTAASSEHSSTPHLICPFYARGLCPAGAAAAAAVRTPLQEGKVFAESLAAERESSSVLGGSSVTASLKRDNDAYRDLRAKSAHRYAGAAAQAAPEPAECDACSYCMDACDRMSCIRCLPRRCHPDALPPYLFSKESSESPSSTAAPANSQEAVPSAAEAVHINPFGEEAGAFSSKTRGLTPSSGASAGEVLRSVEVSSPLRDRLTNQTSDVRWPTRSALVEESHSSHSSGAKGWVRTASAPASGIKAETLEKKNTSERWRLGAGWAPCSWFPYRCLRVLAPPARPLASYSQCQVDRYCRNGGCWLLANGLIYDALPILYAHPGGPSCLLRKRGKDCSRDFSFHSKRGQQLWSNFVVGRVRPCKGWTERKQQQKGHPSADTLRQENWETPLPQRMPNTHTIDSESSRNGAGVARTAYIPPVAPVQSADEVTPAAESKPEHCERSLDTCTRPQGSLNDVGIERNGDKDISGKLSVAEGTSVCRIM